MFVPTSISVTSSVCVMFCQSFWKISKSKNTSPLSMIALLTLVLVFPPQYNWNIVESGAKHHKLNQLWEIIKWKTKTNTLSEQSQNLIVERMVTSVHIHDRFDIQLTFDSDDSNTSNMYDKRNDSKFPIVYFPFIGWTTYIRVFFIENFIMAELFQPSDKINSFLYYFSNKPVW